MFAQLAEIHTRVADASGLPVDQGVNPAGNYRVAGPHVAVHEDDRHVWSVDRLISFVGQLELCGGRHLADSAVVGEVVNRDRAGPERELRLGVEDDGVHLGNCGACRQEQLSGGYSGPSARPGHDGLQTCWRLGRTTVEIGREQAGSRQAVLLGDSKRRCVRRNRIGPDPAARGPKDR